jgi:hypothetical protein
LGKWSSEPSVEELAGLETLRMAFAHAKNVSIQKIKELNKFGRRITKQG